MDLGTLITQLISDGSFATLLLNPLAQFGRPTRRYIGATLLPERPVMENQYEELGIRYRTVIANAGTRYSPAQKKGNEIIGSFDVKLGHSDIANEFTGRDYDALIRLLQRIASGQSNLSENAIAAVTGWFDSTIVLALKEFNEKERWDAIVDAQVVRQGDNAFTETVNISNPAGHRVNALGQWSDDSYDPFDDIFAMAELLFSKGYTVNRIITGQDVIFKLGKNAKVRAAVGMHTVATAGGAVQQVAGRATPQQINAYMGENNLPPMEPYNLQYRRQDGTDYFLKRGTFVMVATTGRNEEIDRGDNEILTMENVIGYEAVGRAAGQAMPGPASDVKAQTDKPPRVEAQSWQTSFPVIVEPEAVGVIKEIT
jgi:Phage major capsid protein E